MRSKPSILILLLSAVALILSGPAVAHAGFISASVDASGEAVSSLTDVFGNGISISGAAGSNDSRSSLPEFHPSNRPDYYEAMLGPSGSGGSMNSQSLTGPSGSAPLAVVADNAQTQTQLIAWLGREGRVCLPPAFMSGVFRPPRFVG